MGVRNADDMLRLLLFFLMVAIFLRDYHEANEFLCEAVTDETVASAVK